MMMTNGLGAFLGATVSGWVVDYFTVNGVKDWQSIWFDVCRLCAGPRHHLPAGVQVQARPREDGPGRARVKPLSYFAGALAAAAGTLPFDSTTLLARLLTTGRVVAERGEIGRAQQLLAPAAERRGDARPSPQACSGPSGRRMSFATTSTMRVGAVVADDRTDPGVVFSTASRKAGGACCSADSGMKPRSPPRGARLRVFRDNPRRGR